MTFALAVVAIAVAAAVLQGERLAALVRSVLPAMEGTIEVRAVTWKARALIDILTDRPTPLLLEGLRVTDPEGAVVLEVPRLDVKVRLRSAIAGKIHLHDMVVHGPATWRFAALKKREGNGFLSSFQAKGLPPVPPPPLPPGSPPPEPFVFQIVNARLEGLNAVLDFPAWGVELRDCHAPFTMMIDGDFAGWDVRDLDSRGGGFLRILTEVLPFDRVAIARVATTRDWPDKIFLEVKAGRTGHSTLTGKGFFTEIYGYGYTREPEAGIAMHAEFDDAADALSAVAAAHALPGLRLGGKAKVALDMSEPFSRMSLGAQIAGLDVAFAGMEARDFGVRASVVFDPLKLTIEDLGFASPAGGRFGLTADLANDRAKARLRFQRFATDPYVPPGLRKLAAGRLAGQIALSADIGMHKRVSINNLDLTMNRSYGAGLPRMARVHGQASASAERVSTTGLVFEVPGATAEVQGEVQLARKLVALGLRASTSDLPRLLTSLGMQPLARGAAVSVEVGGSFKSPEARGEAVVKGINVGGLPEVPELRAQFRLDQGVLHLDRLATGVAGGAIEGSGQVKLFERTLDRMLRSPIVTFKLGGKEIDLATLLASGIVHGRISFAATADGPTDKIRGRVTVPAGAIIEVGGSSWELGGIDVEADLRTLTVRTAKLTSRTGAQIQVEGQMAFAGNMSWKVLIRDVALASLPGIADGGVPVTGKLSADLTASGAVKKPKVSGAIRLTEVNVRGIALGDGELVIAPIGDSGLGLRGNLFRRFDVEASASFGPNGPRASGAVSFNKLVLEQLLPEMTAMGDGNGTASGRVSIEWRPDAPLLVEARLTELAASISRDVPVAGGPPKQERVWVRNAGDLRVVVSGDRVILDEARLVTDGGAFKIRGELAGDTIRAALSGHLGLDLLQPLLEKQVEKLTGDMVVELNVSGPLTKPIIEGSLTVAHPVHIQPVGFAGEIVLGSGALRIAANTVELADLAVTVEDSTLKLRGRTKFDDAWRPVSFEIEAGGEVNASMLETFASTAVSDASGKARIQAKLSGTPAKPELTAKIDLGEIVMRLRDIGRQITVESGSVELTTREVILRDIKTRIDDQGHLLIGSGGAGMRPGRIAIKSLFPKVEIGVVDLPLKAERLTYREPDSLEIDDLGFVMELKGSPATGLKLSGEVLLMSGRYVGDFTVRNLVISRRVSESSARPFYEDQPLIENLALDLRVRTVGDSFMVQNNLAPEIHILVDLRITGTPGEPRIAGELRPTDGRFHIIGLRGDFELVPNVNHITFVETKSVSSGQTPELNLEAQNLVSDSNGNEHNVRMRIRGPVNQASIELSSDDGLDTNQALLLLVSGRTTQDINRFSSTGNPTLGSNFGTGVDMVGQLTRDTVGNLVEPYIDDTLQLLTGHRVYLRPTVGADGFELKLGVRFDRQRDLRLSALRGFQSQQRYRAELNMLLVDYVSSRLFYERLIFSPQQGLNYEINSGNLEMTLDFPLRLGTP